MKLYCPECRSTYDESVTVCPDDGTRLYRLDPADDPLIGSVLDERFRVDWLIGEGGMGSVYRGVQLSVNRKVAIKVLRTELGDRQVALERFFREAKLISGLSHPNIVRLIDFGQDKKRDLLFLVMEMVRGTGLSSLLRQGRLRASFALEIVYQVCGALTEPHAQGIVHRDLKPDNLLLVPMSDGTVQAKVLDFGIARALQRNTRLTQTGMICGTPAYMAPEQSRDQKVDPRTDLYALGVMLYEMLAGKPPFMGQSSLQIMLKHIQEKAQPLRDVLPPGALPDEIDSLVDDLMAKDPADRPDSARAVRERIEELRRRLDLDPVRIDTERAEDATFVDWMLPAMPSSDDLRRGDTLGLVKETDLFARTGDDEYSTADTIAEEAPTEAFATGDRENHDAAATGGRVVVPEDHDRGASGSANKSQQSSTPSEKERREAKSLPTATLLVVGLSITALIASLGSVLFMVLQDDADSPAQSPGEPAAIETPEAAESEAAPTAAAEEAVEDAVMAEDAGMDAAAAAEPDAGEPDADPTPSRPAPAAQKQPQTNTKPAEPAAAEPAEPVETATKPPAPKPPQPAPSPAPSPAESPEDDEDDPDDKLDSLLGEGKLRQD